MDSHTLKKSVCDTIDHHADKIIEFAKRSEETPELGYKEIKTAKLVAGFFENINLPYRAGLALTGIKAQLKKENSRPNVAILGELDAVICPDNPRADIKTGAVHACGHNLQLTAMVGAALGLKLSNIGDKLTGNVTFTAVPAEEYVEIDYRLKLREMGKIRYLGGKQELIYQGEFDDIEIAMMVHSAKNCPNASITIGESSNGFIGKSIQFIGRESHAAASPEKGINALNAAMLGLMGIHVLRETFPDEEHIRVHPVITKGGDLVNVVPADVRMETYIRAKSMQAIEETQYKVDRALRSGGDAVGAKTIIKTIPGYLPLKCSSRLNEVFVENAKSLLPEEKIFNAGHFSASTDMGDVSHLLPAIHPYVGGVSGTLHSREFKIVDYYAACIIPAKLLAMTVIDLLSNNAKKARDIIENFTPILTKSEYINFLDSYFRGSSMS